MKYKKRLEDLQQKTNQDEVVCLPVAYRNYYLEGGENMLADVLEIIEENIEIQNKMKLNQPENKKSIDWRIIGFIALREELKIELEK